MVRQGKRKNTRTKSEWADNTSITKDGVEYSIGVYTTKHGYHASWLCLQCNQGSESSLALATIEAALAQAEENLAMHHEQVHRKHELMDPTFKEG